MAASWQQCSCGLLFQKALPGDRCPHCGQSTAVSSAGPTHPRWFYARDKQKVGPVTLAQLRALLQSGKLKHTDMVFREGWKKWVAAHSVKNLFPVGTPVNDGVEDERPSRDTNALATRSPFRLVLQGGLVAAAMTFLLTAVCFLAGHWALGTFFLALLVAIVGLLLKGAIDVSMAKARAIQRGERSVDLFFNSVKLVLWEENEGLLFLKDKRISEVIYGPDEGGGMRFIFPLFGEEVKVHVPLTLQMSEFADHNVLTRESIRLFVELAFWWRIKDRTGLEKLYLLIGKEVHSVSDTGEAIKEDYSTTESPDLKRGPKRAELNAAEKWMLALVESNLRKLVSKTSVALIVSSRATKYLHVSNQHDEQGTGQVAPLLASENEERDATPDVLAHELQSNLAPEVERYGLEIDRIEVKEVRLPKEIQDAIDAVWKATLLPAQTSQEALARSKQIKAELEAVRDVIGVDAAATDRLLKNLQGMTFYGGLPHLLEQLMAAHVPKAPQEIAKLPVAQPTKSLPDGSKSPSKSPSE
jgi:regulator of protease activity HflC (stomatin/prohibitin superfamily)